MRNYVAIPVYSGDAFLPSNAKSFSLFDMNGAILEIMNGPYVSGMAEYGVGPSQFHPTVDVAPGELPVGASYSDDQIKKLLAGRLRPARRRPPAASLTGSYPSFIFVRQGLFSTDHPNDVGEHYTFTYNGTESPCSWVMQGADLDGTTPISRTNLRRVPTCKKWGIPVTAGMCESVASWFRSTFRTCSTPVSIRANQAGTIGNALAVRKAISICEPRWLPWCDPPSILTCLPWGTMEEPRPSSGMAAGTIGNGSATPRP
jgi:hypothetical protein